MFGIELSLFKAHLGNFVYQYVSNNIHSILETLGVVFVLLLLVVHFKKFIFVVVAVTVVSSMAFAYSSCVHGCVQCMFDKLINDGVCMVTTMSLGGQSKTVYYCDLDLITTTQTGLTEL